MTIVERKKCIVCGKDFIKKRFWHTICSDACRYKRAYDLRKNKNTVITCLNCGINFNPETSKNKFCSLRCNYEYKQKSNFILCEYCGNIFEKKNKSNRFCCREHYFKSAMKRETSLEKELYSFLEKLGIVFEKQKQILHCIPDAYIPKGKICVFADGVYWHTKPDVKERDGRINKRLESAGYMVIRVGETPKRKLDMTNLGERLGGSYVTNC